MKSKNRRRRNRQTAYWVYAKPDQMVKLKHRFTDDVALCKASSRAEAIRKFHVLYGDVQEEDVTKLNNHENSYGIYILTDY